MAWGSESRQKRGYGKEWEALRKQVIQRDKGLCQPCLRKGIVTKFYAVDHITSRAQAKRLGWSKERTEHPSNCQCICDPCHLQKTEEEQGKTKRAPLPQIGLDGFPVG